MQNGFGKTKPHTIKQEANEKKNPKGYRVILNRLIT